MGTVHSFEDLKVWQKSRELCQQVFHVSRRETFAKDRALTEQISRSSGSVMDNIAEGFGRQGRNEFINHLSIANGSLTEVRSQLYRAADRLYISAGELDELIRLSTEIGKMLSTLITYLKSSSVKGLKFKDRSA